MCRYRRQQHPRRGDDDLFHSPEGEIGEWLNRSIKPQFGIRTGRWDLTVVRQPRSGAKVKFARYRETLRTTRAGKPRGVFSHRLGAFATIPSMPLPANNRINTEAPQYAFFKAGRNLSVRCGSNQNKVKTKPRPGNRPPPAGRPRTGQKNASGGPRPSHRPR